MKMLWLLFLGLMSTGCTFNGKLNTVKYWTEDHYMTIGDTVYSPLFRKHRLTQDHLVWLDKEPVTMDREQKFLYALLLHEQHHALQQKGLLRWPFWALCYASNRKFRWKMESEAYKIEVLTLQRLGVWNEAERDSFAKFMANHYNGMIEQADAVAWLNSITGDR